MVIDQTISQAYRNATSLQQTVTQNRDVTKNADLSNAVSNDNAATTDIVVISPQAMTFQELQDLRASAPKIDWVNRTYDGKPISDSYYKEPTAEMLSGEQPFSVWTMGISREKIYVAEKLTERERIMQFDYQQIANGEQSIQGAEQILSAYQSNRSGLVTSNDTLASGLMHQTAKRETEVLTTYLRNTVKEYEQFGISLEEAQQFMLETSEGRFNLMQLLQKYLGQEYG